MSSYLAYLDSSWLKCKRKRKQKLLIFVSQILESPWCKAGSVDLVNSIAFARIKLAIPAISSSKNWGTSTWGIFRSLAMAVISNNLGHKVFLFWMSVLTESFSASRQKSVAPEARPEKKSRRLSGLLQTEIITSWKVQSTSWPRTWTYWG